MENENEVVTPEGEPETPTENTEEPLGSEESVDEIKARLEKEKADAIRQVNARALKAEQEKRELEAKIKASANGKKPLDVEDYIDISASLEGLDQREKEKLAREHKLTGKPLSEIRKDDDFLLWQSAYRAKVEKERALAPSGTQPDDDKPLTTAEKLARAPTLADKEKILAEAGMYRSPRPKTDRTNIGAPRVI